MGDSAPSRCGGCVFMVTPAPLGVEDVLMHGLRGRRVLSAAIVTEAEICSTNCIKHKKTQEQEQNRK